MKFEILKEIGCEIKKQGNKVVMDSSKVKKYEISENLMRQMRSSVVLDGALLGKYRKTVFSYPGDCDIWGIYWTNIR